MWQMPDFLHDTTAFDEEKEKKDAAMAAALAAEKEGEEGTKPEERIAEVRLKVLIVRLKGRHRPVEIGILQQKQNKRLSGDEGYLH